MEVSGQIPGCFITSETAPSTHWIGGWVGPRAGLDAVVKKKIPSPRRYSNLRYEIKWDRKIYHEWWWIDKGLEGSVRSVFEGTTPTLG
jgi:hypothetical protein